MYDFHEEIARLRALALYAQGTRTGVASFLSETDVLIARCIQDLDELSEFFGLPREGTAGDVPSAKPAPRAAGQWSPPEASFEIQGANLAELKEAAEGRLAALAPGTAWSVQLRVTPFARTAAWEVITWEAHVTATAL